MHELVDRDLMGIPDQNYPGDRRCYCSCEEGNVGEFIDVPSADKSGSALSTHFDIQGELR